MSGTQTTLGGRTEKTWRTIVKDAYSTRDGKKNGSKTRLEIVAWRVQQDTYIPPSDGRPGVDDPVKSVSGNLLYGKILDVALDDLGSEEIARRTELKSYRDDRGGRAASTIRGYRSRDDWAEPAREGGYKSSHPVKRVLRRYARSNDLGHFEEDAAGEEAVSIPGRPGKFYSGEIDLQAMFRAYGLARSIASQAGFVFAPQSGEPKAVEDNERIDRDEIRPADRPLGDTKAACFVEKPDGSTYEYSIDLDEKELTALGDAPPPGAI